jgi:DNA-binding winged helix-turn-helix (wHTH) protein/tetratricopeptide (TPR) repeat protein
MADFCTTSVSAARRIYRFGPYRLEAPNGQLFFRDHPVSIQPRQIAVLRVLVEADGALLTKEDLIQQVWLGAAVEDSNITKCVAEIRRILRPGFRDVDPIKTVWKQGYRLDVPVEQVVDEPVPLPEALEPVAPEKAVVRRRSLLPIGIAAALALLTAALWLARRGPSDNTPPSLAVLGMRNLSAASANSDWLSTALTETLSSELEGSGGTRTIPSADVARMRRDLGLPTSAEYDGALLQRVRALLECRWAVTGSYLLAGDTLRLDVRIQDLQSGAVISAINETGDVNHLLDLVARTGASLRQRTGQTATQAAVAHRVSANSEALHLYATGVEHLRQWETAAAREALTEAARLVPDYAPIHLALSETWTRMGFDGQAREEARQAFEHKSELQGEQALRIEGRYAETSANWAKAIEIWQALKLVYPRQPEYAERLASALRSAGRPAESVAMLRQLGSREPGLLLAEAESLLASADYASTTRVATAALGAARERSARFLEARALDTRGNALAHQGEFDKSHADFHEAQQIAEAIGERGGLALALRDEAEAFRLKGELKQARPPAERALAIGREIGDRRTVIRCLSTLGNVSRIEADPVAAKRAFAETLTLAREIGSTAEEGSALLNLGNIYLNTGDPATARTQYEAAHERSKATGDRTLQQISLGNMATADYFTGKLALATSEFQEAVGLAREIGDKASVPYKLIYLGRVALATGDLDMARRYFDEAAGVLRAMGEVVTEPLIWQGALAIAEGRPGDAEGILASLTAKNTRPGPGTKALVVLAEARLARGEVAGARAAADQAIAVAAKSPNRADYGLPADLIRARIDIADGKTGNVASRLQALHEEARRLQNVPHQLTARLAMGELAVRTGDRNAAIASLRELQRTATRLGFGSITRSAARVAEVAGSPALAQSMGR